MCSINCKFALVQIRLGTEPATNHYLNQCWRHMASQGLNALILCCEFDSLHDDFTSSFLKCPHHSTRRAHLLGLLALLVMWCWRKLSNIEYVRFFIRALIRYKDAIFTSIWNPIVEIRRSSDRLISTMGFPILVRWNLHIESAPSTSLKLS